MVVCIKQRGCCWLAQAGCLTDIEVETGNVMSHQICTNRVQSSHVNSHRRMPLRLITISEDNKIYVTAKTGRLLDFSCFRFFCADFESAIKFTHSLSSLI